MGSPLVWAIVAVVLVPLVLALLVWLAAKAELPALTASLRHEQQRLETLRAVAAHFGLEPHGERHAAGAVGDCTVTLTLDDRQFLRARVASARPLLPPATSISQMSDGPYQKHEERAISGAQLTGDDAFDAEFLVYASRDAARALPAELRAIFLSPRIENVRVGPAEGELLLDTRSAPASIAQLDQLLALCARLAALPASRPS